jgi:hypothetical protein
LQGGFALFDFVFLFFDQVALFLERFFQFVRFPVRFVFNLFRAFDVGAALAHLYIDGLRASAGNFGLLQNLGFSACQHHLLRSAIGIGFFSVTLA